MDKKSDWPSPDEQRLNEATGEYYFTPDFTKEVDHEENEIIHRRVAKIVYESLQVSIDWDTEGDLYTKLLTQDASTAPSEVKDTRFFWNEATLYKYAQTSFRGFRTTYKAQVDEEISRRFKATKRANRWKEQRLTVRIILLS